MHELFLFQNILKKSSQKYRLRLLHILQHLLQIHNDDGLIIRDHNRCFPVLRSARRPFFSCCSHMRLLTALIVFFNQSDFVIAKKQQKALRRLFTASPQYPPYPSMEFTYI